MKKYIGDKYFYLSTLRLAIPCALSQLLISCSSIIDSIMVSSIGMVTAVGNARNVLMLRDYVSWGIEAGVIAFASQFFGAKEYKNMAKCQGACFALNIFVSILLIMLTFTVGDKLLLFYLNDLSILPDSLVYLKLVAISLIPLCLTMSIKCMFTAMHETKVTFNESLFYVAVNIVSKYLCIYVFKLGIIGVGVGALITESVCCIGFTIYTIITKPVFFTGLKDMFSFDFSFVKTLVLKILPIASDEILFGFGQSLFNKAYGMLGSSSVEAVYIASEILSLMMFVSWGYGEAVQISVATKLGRGRIDEAKDESRYHLLLSLIVGIVLGSCLIFGGPFFLSLYSVSDAHIYSVCQGLLFAYGIKILLRTVNYVMFCTLKAGGDTKIYNILDSGIMFAVGIPIAFISAYLGASNIIFVVLLCQIEQLIRLFFTLKRYNSYKWANNLTKLVH